MGHYQPPAHTPRKATRRYADIAISILIGFALWFAHFGKAVTYDGNNYPPMNRLFEFLFANGRYLALASMAAVVIVYLGSSQAIPVRNFRGAAAWMAALNLYITSKVLFYGNSQFFVEASLVIGITIVTMVMIVSRVEIKSISDPKLSGNIVATSVWVFAFLLVATNIVALLAHPGSALNSNGRMHGTTVNPQHLAMMCALAVPATIYAILRFRPMSVVGVTSIAILCAIFVIEHRTASRMGFAAAMLGLIVGLREYITGRKAVAGVIVGGLLSLMVYSVFGQNIENILLDRFVVGREDTRSSGWGHAWDTFMENPIFGVEPNETGRLVFIENFWLAAASTGGIVALALSVPIFVGFVKTGLRIRSAVRVGRVDASFGNFYLAALVVIFGVAFFEAALLGIIAAHTMLAYIYFASSANLVRWIEYRSRAMRVARKQQVGVGR